MKQQPIVAFLYDFDKTLCTTDMQDYAFIPSLGMTPAEFWAEANGFGRRNRCDSGTDSIVWMREGVYGILRCSFLMRTPWKAISGCLSSKRSVFL